MSLANSHYFKDTAAMLGRSLKHIARSADTIITVCLVPIAIMLMFVYVFGGALGDGMNTSEYVDYALPGILLISIASASAYTAARMFADKESGFFSRLRSMPIPTSSALWAHMLTSLLSNALSLAIIFLVASVMGFRSSASLASWLAVAGILALFTLALSWVAAIAGLKARSAEGAGVFSYPLIFLPFVSSAFLPTETMPSAVRAFADNQPVTAIVDSVRTLLAGQPIGGELWVALAWCVGIMLIAWFFAMKAYRKGA